MNYRLVITTCPDGSNAEMLAEALVSAGLAACVSYIPGARSIYEWQGKLEREEEVVLLIKSRADRYPLLEAEIRARHPYDVPEIIALPIEAGSAPYLRWIDSQLDKTP